MHKQCSMSTELVAESRKFYATCHSVMCALARNPRLSFSWVKFREQWHLWGVGEASAGHFSRSSPIERAMLTAHNISPKQRGGTKVLLCPSNHAISRCHRKSSRAISCLFAEHGCGTYARRSWITGDIRDMTLECSQNKQHWNFTVTKVFYTILAWDTWYVSLQIFR